MVAAVVLIGISLWNILPPYIDRWKSAQDYKKLADTYDKEDSLPED